MTVAFETGYTLPSGDLPLNHARVLHDGNRFKVKTITASSELALYPGTSANSGDTVDRWRPFANEFTDPTDFSTANWGKTNITVASDGQTLNEGTAVSAARELLQNGTVTLNVDYVSAAIVEPQTAGVIYIQDIGGTNNHFASFDLRTQAVANETNATGKIVDLGNNRFLCLIKYTATLTEAIQQRLYLADDAASITYTGTGRAIKIEKRIFHESEATLTYDLFTAQEGDTFAIAAHNLWSSGATLTVQHDSNNDDTWTTIGSVTPTDNSPVMFIYEPITSAKWRIQVSGGALPEVGVFRVGRSLQMERPFYGGFTIPSMARNTAVRGNISGSGELLGRSKERTTLRTQYQWQHLSYDWVRANLDGPTGLIQAAESEPVFVAWRPSVTQDVDYVMRASTDAPNAMGLRDLWTFGISGEAHSYE